MLSVIAWILSAYVLHGIMTIFSIEKKRQSMAMLIYALLPSSVLLTSVTLREAYQLFFINLAFFFVAKIHIQHKKIYWILIPLPLIAMSILHWALLIYSALFLTSFIYIIIVNKYIQLGFTKIGWGTTVFMVLTMTILMLLLNNSSYGSENGIAAAVQVYIERGITLANGARASYRESIHIDDTSSLLLYLSTAFFQYFTEPMPWRNLKLLDLVAILENYLRIWLIYKLISNAIIAKFESTKGLHLLLIFSYFVSEFIWSIGTINWGTAMRHHVPAMGLLLVAAFLQYSVPRNDKVN